MNREQIYEYIDKHYYKQYHMCLSELNMVSNICESILQKFKQEFISKATLHFEEVIDNDVELGSSYMRKTRKGLKTAIDDFQRIV